MLTSLCAGKGKAPQPSSQTRLFVLKSVDWSSVYNSLFQDGWTSLLDRQSVRLHWLMDAGSHLAASAFPSQGQAWQCTLRYRVKNTEHRGSALWLLSTDENTGNTPTSSTPDPTTYRRTLPPWRQAWHAISCQCQKATSIRHKTASVKLKKSFRHGWNQRIQTWIAIKCQTAVNINKVILKTFPCHFCLSCT